MTASEVLNLAQSAPVRARFGFTDDNLEDITRWVRQANVRWGFDQEHRQPYGVDFVHNTWRFGIDRVLAGVAMSDDAHAWIDSTLPLDDVSSNRVELAGQLAEFVDRLQRTVDALTGARPLRALAARADRRHHAADPRRRRRRLADQSDATRVRPTCSTDAGARSGTVMRLPDVKALLDRHLAGRPTRANFRTGTLTVCTMVPMRSVPHRVVCLVGLDDGVFPRQGVIDGDDVLARNPMTGERDIRSEDRQLLLDAVGAATEKLVITYTGANAHSGQARPPAVPLAELLDALDATTPESVRERDRRASSVAAVRHSQRHPRRADPRRAVHLRLHGAKRAAQASTGERSEQPKFISGPLPAPPHDDVALADLVGFFKDPVKGFFRALEYTLPWDVDGVDDEISVDIDALEQWAVGDRMLQRHAARHDARRGAAGRVAPRHAAARSAGLAQGEANCASSPPCSPRRARRYRKADADAYDVDIDLGAGRRLTGTVSPVFGDRLVSVTYSKLDGKHLLAVVDSVAGVVRSRIRAATGRPSASGGPSAEARRASEVLGRPQDPAVDLLRDLVAIYDAGRREPLPLPIKTSYAWARPRHERRRPGAGGGLPVEVQERYPGEDQDPAQVRAWGQGLRG